MIYVLVVHDAPVFHTSQLKTFAAVRVAGEFVSVESIIAILFVNMHMRKHRLKQMLKAIIHKQNVKLT